MKKSRESLKIKSSTCLVMLLIIAIVGYTLWAVSKTTATSTSPSTAPLIVNDNVDGIVKAHTFKLIAWCDHMPIWKESPDRRHLLVVGDKKTEIQAVEVRVGHGEHTKLLSASVRLGTHNKNTDLSKMQLEGAFKEGMHLAELDVTIRYTVDGIKYETIRHCVVEVTN